MSKTLDLTKQLVAIPSWVGAGCNEIAIGEFIYDWLQTNTDLNVIKQPVKDGRFNVIAYDDSPTTLLLNGHMDTVEAGGNWTYNPFTPTIKGDRLYGRGTTDMKGSLAAMLSAVEGAKNTKGLMVLCYIDEEYDFGGMLKFVEVYKDKIKPKLVVSLDGYANTIGYACRGLIEVRFKVRGKSGHAGRPSLGKNAILLGTELVNLLIKKFESDYTDPIQGSSTCNLAYLNGGLDLGDGNVGQEGNNIADIAELVLDIRLAVPSLDAKKNKKLVTAIAKKLSIQIESWSTRHNLGAWLTDPKILQNQLNISAKFEPFRGYVDTQMLWQCWDGVTCCAIGASSLPCAHAVDEYVELNNLETTYLNVAQIIKKFTR